ncbi:MAG: hypothetical protein LBJ18_03095 [Rickettsiales bacterium]|nr:hypothetical protein [Rickettsiales bacterium]
MIQKIPKIFSALFFAIFATGAAYSAPTIQEQLAEIKAAGWDTSNDPNKKSIYDEIVATLSEMDGFGDELLANENAMKEKENSAANKALGAGAMGAVGMGGKMLLSGMAEQSADKAIQEEMQGVLNSMYCKVPNGTKINYGTTDNPLPGDGVAMAEMRAEYERIATQLKSDKEMLGMLPGIESETVFDKSATGLYDKDTAGYKVRQGEGNIASVFGSLAGNDKDKAAWDAQTAESKTQVNAGIGLAATGVVGGIVGNMLINKDAPKENSAEIMARRNAAQKKLDGLSQKLKSTADGDIENCNKQIQKNKDLAAKIKSGDARLIPLFQKFIDEIDAVKMLTADDFAKIKDIKYCACDL